MPHVNFVGTITLEEYRRQPVYARRSITLDNRSIDERREARYLNSDYTGRQPDWADAA
jgi:hypothetical protein